MSGRAAKRPAISACFCKPNLAQDLSKISSKILQECAPPSSRVPVSTIRVFSEQRGGRRADPPRGLWLLAQVVKEVHKLGQVIVRDLNHRAVKRLVVDRRICLVRRLLERQRERAWSVRGGRGAQQ